MAKKILHIDASKMGKLICDAPGCGHVETVAHEFGPHLIGRPCPRCGASLLTRSDFVRAEKLLRFVDRLNRWFGPIFGTENPTKGGHQISIHTHGSKTTIRAEPTDDRQP